MMGPLLAQVDEEVAASVIDQSLKLSAGIHESWEQIWTDLLGTSNGLSLWSALVRLAVTLAAFSLLYMILRYGQEISKNQYLGTIIEMMIFPLVVVVLLGNNGHFLAECIRLIRGIGESTIQSVGEIQLAGIQLTQAVEQFEINHLSVERIRQLYSECQGLAGAALNECFESKRPIAEGILSAFDGTINLAPAGAFLKNILSSSSLGTVVNSAITAKDFFQGGFAQVIQFNLYPFVEFLLFAMQWAFLNMVEAALFLTAAFAPIAVALSLLPLAGRPVWAWLCGFISLLGLKLGYTIVVGVVAVVMVNVEGDFAEIAASSGFLAFIAIFAPFLATGVATGGGIALYQGISSRANALASMATQGVSTLVMSVVRVKM